MFLSVATMALATGQSGPSITHEGLLCVPDDFPVVGATIEPDFEVRTAKVYFRSDTYPDFYYIEMAAGIVTGSPERFLGLLPRASSETENIIYYVEAVDVSFNASRTVEHSAEVDEQCERSPETAYFTQEDPGIVVGSTAPGASPIPPGFRAAGIVGFIAASGIASSTGGGLGAGVAIGLAGAAGAGAAGFVTLSGNKESSSTTTAVTSPATTTQTTTTPTSSSTSSTATTTPPEPAPPPSSSTTSTTTTGPLNACFDMTLLNECHVKFDGSCSTGEVDRYQWVLDTGAVIELVTASSPSPIKLHDWGSGSDCAGKTILNSLTVVDEMGATSQKSMPFTFPVSARSNVSRATSVTFRSHLATSGSEPRGAGRLVVHGRQQHDVDNQRTYIHRAKGTTGRNTVTAFVLPGLIGDAIWSFDFTRSAGGFEPGTLLVEQGRSLSVSSNAVVFRVRAGERVRFSYVLSP